MKQIIAFLLFFSPLVFTTSNEDSFDLPKTVLIRAAAFISLLIVLYRALQRKEKKFTVSFIDIAFLTWLAILLISSLLSINIFLSLQGQYKFYAYGFINSLCMCILYCASKDTADVNIAKISILSSVIVSIYGILQYLDTPLFGLKLGYSRYWIFSTLGNPVYVGNFLSLCFVFSLIFYITERKAYYLISTIIIWSGIIISQCRSAWLSTTLTLFITTYACYKYSKSSMKHIMIVFLLLIGTFLLLSLPAKLHTLGKRKGEVTSSSIILSRARSIISYRENRARVENWHTALRIFSHCNVPYGNNKENRLLRLLFGSGPDTFYYIFPGYKTLGYVRSAGRNMTAAHAHNELLQSLTTAGIFGTIAYLFLICLSIYYSIKLFTELKSFKLIIFPLFFVVYFFNSMFNPATVVPATYFFIFLSILHSHLLKECSIKRFSFALPHSISVFLLTCIVAINIAILYITLRAYVADVIFFNTKSINDDLQNKEKKLSLVVKLAPQNAYYSMELVRCWKKIADNTDSITVKKYYLANAIKENKRIINIFPCMPDYWYNLGASCMWYWQLAKERYVDETREDVIELAKEAFLNTIRVSPMYIDGYNILGKYFGAIGKEKIGLHFWSTAISLDPTMEEAREHFERVSKKWTSGKN